MNNVRMKNITATELFRQQVASTIQGIRYQNDQKPGTYLPLQLGGIFTQQAILSGGNVMRITEMVNNG